MVHVLFSALLVAAVCAVFGIGATMLLLPAEWRRWWPLGVFPIGLASFVVIQQPLSTVASTGATAWVGVAIALVIAGATWRWRVPLPRPSAWCAVTLVVCLAGAALSYAPSLKYRDGRPSSIFNRDAIYYLSTGAWFEDHKITDAPPPPHVDGFWAPARQTYEHRLRVGFELFTAASAKVTGIDLTDSEPAAGALLLLMGGLSIALFLLALRAPPWAAAVAAGVVTLRPESVRLVLDSFLAQTAGLALVPVTLGALAIALRARDRRSVVLAGLLVTGTIGFYVEYAPFLVIAGLLLLGVVLWEQRDGRGAVLLAALGVAAVAVVLGPLGVVRGLHSLTEQNHDVGGEAIVPWYGFVHDLAFLDGPFSVARATGDVGLFVAIAAVVLGVLGILGAKPAARGPVAAAAVAGLVFALQQAYLDPYSYGFAKVLSVAAPFTLAGLVLLVAHAPWRPAAALGAAGLAGLVVVNLNASVDLARASLRGVDAMTTDDQQLESLVPKLRSLPGPIALEGTDIGTSYIGRQHFAVWFLRRAGLHVTYARGFGSYYTMNVKIGAADVDETYRPDYHYVVSYGPSIAHGQPIMQSGRWYVYQRAGAVDLMPVGAHWQFPSADARDTPFRWSLDGDATLWASAPRFTSRVRLRFDVRAPLGVRHYRVVVGTHVVDHATVPYPGLLHRLSRPFGLPAGKTDIHIVTDDAAPAGGYPAPVGVGVSNARIVPS